MKRMKRIISIFIMTALMLAFNNVKAQQCDILYTYFDPPLTLLGELDSDTLEMDFNQDGQADFGICWLGYPWTAYFLVLNPDWDYMVHQPGDTTTISSVNTLWQHANGYISFDDDYEWGVRLKYGSDYYYGWAYTDAFSESNPGMPHNKIYIAIREIAFCTIPDYPLRWGQTSLTEDVWENEATAFAVVHPNPTTGLVRIFGQDLKSAEVVNMLGQRVATAQGKGETLQIDIADLPAGVYFVRVTDEEGRKCVRKVVKE